MLLAQYRRRRDSIISPLCPVHTHRHVGRTRCRSPDLLGNPRVPTAHAFESRPTRLRSCLAGLLSPASELVSCCRRGTSPTWSGYFRRDQGRDGEAGLPHDCCGCCRGGGVWLPTAARVPMCAVVMRKCISWAMSRCWAPLCTRESDV
eukprot:1587473-Prymnesium_polylepis.1